MKKILEYAFISLAFTALGFFLAKNLEPKIIDGGRPWSRAFDNSFGCNTKDITDMYAGYVERWKRDIKNAFGEAEIKVYNITPTPDIVGPDEDPAKCICKGTGIIRHGDGHTTSCPYHGSKFNQPVIILEK